MVGVAGCSQVAAINNGLVGQTDRQTDGWMPPADSPTMIANYHKVLN